MPYTKHYNSCSVRIVWLSYCLILIFFFQIQ